MLDVSSDRYQRPMACTRALTFLVALVAVVATILSSASASAATTGVAETRVGAHTVVLDKIVGPPEHIRAGQRLGKDPAGVVDAVATGVAANAGPRTLDIGGGSFPGIAPKSVIRTPEGVVSVNPNVAHAPSVVGRSQQLPFADNSFTNVMMDHFPADQFGGGTLPRH